MKHRAIFQKFGMLALMPKAFGLVVEVDDAKAEPFREENGVAIVSICGPLTHHAEWWFDSYDAVKQRVASALASSCKAVLLQIDSPGGEVAGLYETARELRAMAQAAKKPMVAHVDGLAASGGYALACAAEKIVCPETSFVGSVGVIETMMEHVAADKAYGLNVAVVTSGARKADGHPCAPLTEGALNAAQKRVDSLANGFFELVSELRGMSVESIRSLEAGVFHGIDAVKAGLADAVMTKEQALAMVASAKTGPANAAAEGTEMDWKEAMRKAAADGDEDAKKALAAIDDEEDKAEDKKDEPKSEDKKDDKAADDKDEPKSEDKKDEPKSEGKDDDEAKAIAAKATLVADAGTQDRRIAALEQRAENEEREKILAEATKTKQLTTSQLKVLRAESLPSMKKILALIPDVKPNAAAALSVKPTVGASRGNGGASLPAETPLMQTGERTITAGEVDERMGLTAKSAAPRWEGRDRVYPMALDRASEKAAAKTLLDERAAAKGGAR